MKLSVCLAALTGMCSFATASVPSGAASTLFTVTAPSSLNPASGGWPTCTSCDIRHYECLNGCGRTKECIVHCDCLLCQNKYCERNCGYTNCCEAPVAAGKREPLLIVPTITEGLPTLTEKPHAPATPLAGLNDVCSELFSTYVKRRQECPDDADCQNTALTEICWAGPTRRNECTWDFCGPAQSPREICVRKYNEFGNCAKFISPPDCSKDTICKNIPQVDDEFGRCAVIKSMCNSRTKSVPPPPVVKRTEAPGLKFRPFTLPHPTLTQTETAAPRSTESATPTSTERPSPTPPVPGSECYGCYKEWTLCVRLCSGNRDCTDKCSCHQCRTEFCSKSCGFDYCRYPRKSLLEGSTLDDPVPSYILCGK